MTEKLRLFDPDLAYEHTQNLCYPRRVGTVGERKAARYIIRQFTSLGLRWAREKFLVSHFPAEIGNRLAFVLCALLGLVTAVVAGSSPLLTVLCASLAALLVNAPWWLYRFVGSTLPPRSSSANVLATLPDTSPVAPVRVVFLAHYDTKSQWLPTGVRVLLVTLTTALFVLIALAGLAAALGGPNLLDGGRPWRLAVIAVCLLGGLFLNFTGNRSPGALDNGSAVGTLLELARSWRPQPGAPAEVIWVATGSEEVELDGARHLLRTHGSWWEDKPTLVINLESVGAGASVYLSGERRALDLAREVAGELAIETAPFFVLGAGMDHEPFAAQGLPAVSILGDVIRKSFAMHSRRDDMRLIDKRALERAGRLASHLAWRWAQMHQPAGVPDSEMAPAAAASVAR